MLMADYRDLGLVWDRIKVFINKSPIILTFADNENAQAWRFKA